MEVHTSTEKPYRNCWYGFGTVYQFQYQLGTVLGFGTIGTVFILQKFRKMRKTTKKYLQRKLSELDRIYAKIFDIEKKIENNLIFMTILN